MTDRRQKDLSTIIDGLISDLKNAGFVILRYDAYSTSSVYLKMDYGVAGSIRISNHRGKKHLNYRFNLRTDIESSYSDSNRNYYCLDDINCLIEDIINFRESRLTQYGASSYNHFMKENCIKGVQSKGFWQKAKRV